MSDTRPTKGSEFIRKVQRLAKSAGLPVGWMKNVAKVAM